MKRSDTAEPRKASDKILAGARLGARLRAFRRSGRKLVFTNGCFDILHLGHVRYLQAARRKGQALFIGLNSDASVRRLKGPDRPLNDQRSRAEVLAALECVDFVCVFTEDTPERLIRRVRPDLLVKGGDWKKEQIAGGAFVESYGGKVMLIPYVDGHSTTGLVKRIRKA